MKTYIVAAAAAALVISSGIAQAAVYLKLDGVKGETSAVTEFSATSVARATTSATSDTGGSAGDVVETQMTGATTIQYSDADKDGDSTGKKGKVEGTWKVEEGQKAGPALLEIDGIKGESSDKKGNVDPRDVGQEPQEGKTSKVDSISIKQSGLRGGISIAVGDVNGLTDEEKQAFMMRVKEHPEVKSEQDLANFAKGILLENAQTEQISLNFEKIKMSTKGTGKLLGFIPMSFVQKVEVDTEGDDAGKVKVRLPWYALLMKVDVSAEDIEEEATRAVVANLGNNKNWDFGARALALKAVSNILKTKHDTAKNAVSNIR